MAPVEREPERAPPLAVLPPRDDADREPELREEDARLPAEVERRGAVLVGTAAA